MNEFQYELELAKIDSCKYIKDTRELIYKYYNKFYIHYWSNIKNLQSSIYQYKLYSKTFTKFNSASKTDLPDKFYTLMDNYQSQLLYYILNKSIVFTYEQFLSMFEYTELVKIPNLSEEQLKKLCNIIEDNPLPFKCTINVHPRALHAYSYFNNLSDSKEFAILSWMKINNIPESNTLANIFRKQHKYTNTQEAHDKTIEERDSLTLAIEAIDQLTGEQIVQQ